MSEYYNLFRERIKYGHYEYLSNYIIPNVYKYSDSKNIKLENIITNYCAKILLKFININTKKFNTHKYISNVYLKNLDVYGLVMSFSPYISMELYNNNQLEITYQEKRKIAILIHKYCFSHSNSDIPINSKNLMHDINNITKNSDIERKTKRRKIIRRKTMRRKRIAI